MHTLSLIILSLFIIIVCCFLVISDLLALLFWSYMRELSSFPSLVYIHVYYMFWYSNTNIPIQGSLLFSFVVLCTVTYLCYQLCSWWIKICIFCERARDIGLSEKVLTFPGDATEKQENIRLTCRMLYGSGFAISAVMCRASAQSEGSKRRFYDEMNSAEGLTTTDVCSGRRAHEHTTAHARARCRLHSSHASLTM